MGIEPVPPIISILDGDLDIHDSVSESVGFFCFEDAVSDDLEVIDVGALDAVEEIKLAVVGSREP